jgi:Flp pilus assembly protein TadD, contains TPR repeats
MGMQTIDDLLEKGREAIRKNDGKKGADYFRQAYEADPNSIDAMLELGRISAAMGNLKEGQKLIDLALQIQQDHAFAHMLKGITLNLEKKYGESIVHFQRALQMDPNLQMAYANMGMAQREMGDLIESEANLKKAIELNPDDYEAHYALGFTLSVAGKVEAGIMETLESIRINPLFMPGYLALGAMYTAGGRTDVAETIYHEGLRHNPDATPIRERLHQLSNIKKDFATANGDR